MKPETPLNKRKLSRRVFFVMMGFALVFLVLSWLFQIVLLESFYKQIKKNALRINADTVAEAINDSDFLEIITEVAVENNIAVKIINCADFSTVYSIVTDEDTLLHDIRHSELYFIYEDAREHGGTVFQTFQRGTYMEDRLDLYDTIEEGGKGRRKSTSDKDGALSRFGDEFKRGAPPLFKNGITQEMLMSRIVQAADGTEYLIVVDSVVTPIASTVRTLKAQLFYISVIVLVLAALLAEYLSRKVTKPISDINRSAKKLAEGDYHTTFSADGYLEISQLADTLNYTARELALADSLKQELIANTSHDLRTPLTMIIGYAEVMRDLPGENTPENVQVIIDEATRLTTLVNDMLDLSKLQSGSIALTKTEFNLTQLTSEICERIRKMTEKDGYVIAFSPEKNVFIHADETRITQVIYNFLSNAVNYSEPGSSIEITQECAHGRVRISITDHGKGIPKEKLPNIWDRYYKVDNTHKRSAIGSGIGLSIVKTILEMHDAKYGVISTVGEGSTFWFEMPLSDVI